jgi:hypothetical protein
MANALRSSDTLLAAGTTWPLRRARGYHVACLRGELWITIDGRLDDIFLEPGDTFPIDGDGRVVVFAVKDSAVRVCAPAAAPSARGWRAALRNAFA